MFLSSSALNTWHIKFATGSTSAVSSKDAHVWLSFTFSLMYLVFHYTDRKYNVVLMSIRLERSVVCAFPKIFVKLDCLARAILGIAKALHRLPFRSRLGSVEISVFCWLFSIFRCLLVPFLEICTCCFTWNFLFATTGISQYLQNNTRPSVIKSAYFLTSWSNTLSPFFFWYFYAMLTLLQ